MSDSDDASADSPAAPDEKFVRDARFLAAALRSQSETARAGREPNIDVLECAGWTIYEAEGLGLLRGTLKLADILKPDVLQALAEGNPKRLGDDDRCCSPIERDTAKTIKEFIWDLNAATTATPLRGTGNRRTRSGSGGGGSAGV